MRSSGNVLVAGIVGVDVPVRAGPAVDLPSADLEIELVLAGLLVRTEPASLGRGRRPGGEHLGGRGLVGALEDEGGVYRSFAHDSLLCSCSSGCLARYSPSRSSRRSQFARRSVIQCSAVRSAVGSMWQVRTRPTFSDRTRPLVSSTCRCWTTAGRDMGSGPASSLTEAGPRLNRSTIVRRVGSESAWYR